MKRGIKMYNVGMYCKHFKGKNLLEKNIYKILKVNVTGKDIKDKNIIYTGDKENLNDVKNLPSLISFIFGLLLPKYSIFVSNLIILFIPL